MDEKRTVTINDVEGRPYADLTRRWEPPSGKEADRVEPVGQFVVDIRIRRVRPKPVPLTEIDQAVRALTADVETLVRG